MTRIRVQQKVRREREDRTPVLPLDPRDPDLVRIKGDTDTTVRVRARW